VRGPFVLTATLALALAGCRTPQSTSSNIAAPERVSHGATSPEDVLGQQRASMAESDQERAGAALDGATKPAADRRDRPVRPPVRPPH
jgi:hypothetical protein